jgi:hypothetical protein
MIQPRTFRVFWILLLSPAAGPAQTSYPMVSRIEPAALQAGRSAEFTISGTQDFSGASALLFEGSGLSAEVVDAGDPGKKATSVTFRIVAQAGTALGPREFRVVTPQGVSSVGLLVIVADPVTREADDKANDSARLAQELTLPSVATGSIGRAEDVDWYRFTARAGQTLTFSVWGNRLENKIHDLQTHFDPILTLTDFQGRELAADDNALFADPRLAFRFPEDGTYYLQIRDTTYSGNASWTYVLHATDGPVATSVFPLAVSPGQTEILHAIGVNLEQDGAVTANIPPDVSPGVVSLPLSHGKRTTPPLPLVVVDLPRLVEEQEAPARPDKAGLLTLPVALSGRFDEPGDVDCFLFEARKGQSLVFEVIARRAGSAVDPIVRTLRLSGAILSEVDDTYGKDPRLEWTAPSDGVFAVQLQDLHGRGGPGLGYVLLARPARPDFVLTCDPDKVNIGPGARSCVFVKVERREGFSGPVRMAWDGLPPGVTASPVTVPANMAQGETVLTAAADSPRGASLVTLRGTGPGPDGPLVRLAEPRQEIYLPGGGRGLYSVETLAVAVTDRSDITVDATPTEITLKPGESATLDVTIQRREGFAQPVNLAVDLMHLGGTFASGLPPGVSLKASASKTLIDGQSTTGRIVLEARPDAPACDRVPIAVMGHVSINFVVKTAYCSAPILLSVTPSK